MYLRQQQQQSFSLKILKSLQFTRQNWNPKFSNNAIIYLFERSSYNFSFARILSSRDSLLAGVTFSRIFRKTSFQQSVHSLFSKVKSKLGVNRDFLPSRSISRRSASFPFSKTRGNDRTIAFARYLESLYY